MESEEGDDQQRSAFVGNFGDYHIETGVPIFPVDVTNFPAVIDSVSIWTHDTAAGQRTYHPSYDPLGLFWWLK